jgi:hypothetical protein
MKSHLLIIILSSVIASKSIALDAESLITRNKTFNDWSTMEFSGPDRILYRIGSESLNFPDQYTLTFDFDPRLNCTPRPALLIIGVGTYKPHMANGFLVMKHKTPGAAESKAELYKTFMNSGDTFAFVQTNLTVGQLEKSNNKGRLAFWVAPSRDGVVSRGPNIYFSLSGFIESQKEARKSCLAQK